VTRIPDRRDEIAAFFAAHANHIRSCVARRARTAHDVVDDACATAWTKLLRRPDVALNARGLAWLVTVAVHEAWRLQERRAQETPVGPYARAATGDHDHVPEPSTQSALTWRRVLSTAPSTQRTSRRS
jgi:DNA-directed RNA polymerase specialized sigma24 family protein